MNPKPHLDIEDQLLRLVQRGMQVPDQEEAAKFLGRFNYYRFAEYTFAFIPEEHRLQGNIRFSQVSFSNVVALIEFDFQLRNLLFEELSRFEIKLRTVLAYAGGREDPAFHITGRGIRPELLALESEESESHASWLSRYTKKIQVLSPEDITRNYDLENTAEIPIWGAVELMDLGQLSRLYRMTDQALSSRIASAFHCSPSLLKSWIPSINILRNHVAHQSRIWNRSFPFPPKTNSAMLPFPLTHVRDVEQDINLLYPRVAILAWLGRDRFLGVDFRLGLKNLVKNLPIHEQISPVQMGFPSDWADKELWN